MSKSEEAFINEYTRTLLVEWARQTVAHGNINEPTKAGVAKGTTLYFDYAIKKGWVSKAAPHRVLAKGFAAAASFLRR